MDQTQIWKIYFFHSHNRGLEGLESFVLNLYAHINTAFCFYIYGTLQVDSCDHDICFDAVEIR